MKQNRNDEAVLLLPALIQISQGTDTTKANTLVKETSKLIFDHEVTLHVLVPDKVKNRAFLEAE
jgi:hypothetical protein